MEAYRSLEQKFARLGTIKDATSILQWDAETMMPDGAADGRSSQVAMLTGIAHQMLAARDVGALLDEAEADKDKLDPWQRANLREMRRAYRHAAAVPGDLVEANSTAVSRAKMAWREARRQSDFAQLLPHLAEVLQCQRQIARAKGDALGLTPYDALLDSYDPGLRQSTVDPLFADLRAELPVLIAEARAAQGSQPEAEPLRGPFAPEVQRRIGESLMRAAGFDFDRGRLDDSRHPFCGGSGDDVRITTRYDEADFMGALMAVLHETGHALYEQGRPRDWLPQPVGKARGMSLHESQSLLFEMQAGRTREFIAFLAPLVRDAFNGHGPAWSAENLYRTCTRVEPGFIRVDADEVTYPAHIIVRYDLEKALIADDLRLADLPAAFNDGVQRLLGLTVPNDALGCLQDIHWPGGAWGYFPTYTLGAATAAQLFQAACRAEPALLSGLAVGDFGPLRHWLRTNVHCKGSLLEADALLVAATGRSLDASVYRNHLRRRYVEH